MIEPPDAERLKDINDMEVDQLPDFAMATREWDQPTVEDIEAAAREAIDDIGHLDSFSPGDTVAITAGSRGIHDLPELLRHVVSILQERDLEPYIIPAMGSHGGASAEGQLDMLRSLGVTEDSMGCEIRSSLDVTQVGTNKHGQPVYAADDALDADGVILANRVKAHTDFEGDIESGLCKIAVIGVGKQRGADTAHNAALIDTFRNILPEHAQILFDETPIIGGIGLIENAHHRAAEIQGLPVEEIIEREPELLARSKELLPTLPFDEIDLLIVEEQGKNISGSGMDTNVIGRLMVHGEPEYESPSIARIHVRSVTEESHHNAVGLGLADFAHENLVRDTNLTDTYINTITGGEPARGRIPAVMPDDETALLCAFSTCGVTNPSEMRIVRIKNTMEPGRMQLSEPLFEEVADHENIELGDRHRLELADGDLIDVFE